MIYLTFFSSQAVLVLYIAYFVGYLASPYITHSLCAAHSPNNPFSFSLPHIATSHSPNLLQHSPISLPLAKVFLAFCPPSLSLHLFFLLEPSFKSAFVNFRGHCLWADLATLFSFCFRSLPPQRNGVIDGGEGGKRR